MSFNKRMLSAGGAAEFVPSGHFGIVTYTGNSSDQSITGLGFQPDLVWIKERNDGNENHNWIDSTRGTGNILTSNSTGAAFASGRFTSFDSDGFTLANNNETNDNNVNYVAWCWKAGGGSTSSNSNGDITSTVQANTDAGFSIVSYTGNGTDDQTVGHGLTAKCDLVIIKDRSSADKWLVQLPQLGDTARMVLEGTAAKTDDDTTTQAGNTTVFGIGNDNSVNKSSDNYIAYCFHSVAGFSKIGSYTGGGSNATIVETGFEPAFLMVKPIGYAGVDWFLIDNARSTTNPRNERLRANTHGAEDTTSTGVNFLSNGFELQGGGAYNDALSGGWLYWAIAADADEEAPALADSFNARTWTGDGVSRPITGFGFDPNLVIIKSRSYARNWYWYDYIRGANNQILSNTYQIQATNADRLTAFITDGFTAGTSGEVNTSSETYVAYGWQADDNEPTINTNGTGIDSIVSVNANAGFSIVKYTGTGNSSHTVGHGLSSAPKFFINKSLGHAQGWCVVHDGLSTGYNLGLHNTGAQTNSMGGDGGITKGDMNSTTFGFTAGSSGVDGANKSGVEFISYCFTEVAGYSKFGTYTGSGSAGNAQNVGFQPDFLLFRRYNNSDNWVIVDTARGEDNYLLADTTNTEQNLDILDFTSTGWTFKGSSMNNSSDNYLYAAFKINTSAADAAGKMAWLVVGGGGEGGGESNSGGGGAGGLRTSYGSTSGGGGDNEGDIHLAAGTYTITIGAGGSGNQYQGGDGSDSSIAKDGMTTITSTGGGGGVGQSGNPSGRAGGSGGGGGYNNQAGGSGTSNQGYAGGAGVASNPHPGGGGGGAGEAGNTDGNGTGGDGLAVSITGSSVTYAGGGSGGVSAGASAIAGSDGGGGAGAAGNSPACVAGTVNTGSGGGGGAAETKGADGGSGVVILRLLTSEYSGTVTGSPTVTTSGSSTIIKFTASGTYVHS